MIQKLGANFINSNQQLSEPKTTTQPITQTSTNAPKLGNYTATGLVNAYQAFHGIKLARTVSFGQNLKEAFTELNAPMTTCQDLSKGKKGESVGSRVDVSGLISKYDKEIPGKYDAIKTNIDVLQDKTYARTQLKRSKNDGILYEMSVKDKKYEDVEASDDIPLLQSIKITQDPNIDENAYVLNTKGKLMSVVEDGNNVLLTNAGKIDKKAEEGSRLSVKVEQNGNVFKPFTPEVQSVKERTQKPSIGEGTEIVIGMEEGRFVPEIIDSIKDFVDKVDNGEIVLDQFHANPNANNTQLAMLAGGFGSRAEYTNASSDGIFHSQEKPDGAQSTKGVFRTATGLTPMETTFISLHNAGLLDCSKGKLGIGKNIKFYLNESGVNKGNGGFTVDLYNKMEREGRNSLTLFPNDSMSRLTGAAKEMSNIMNSGNAAIAMIAKEVKSDDAKGNFGIMKLGPNNEILEFAEKPKEIPAGYERNGKCLTNTFQFSVSKEAFEALSILEAKFPNVEGKEPKDWSKTYIPILMSLTQENSNNEKVKDTLKKVLDTQNLPEEINDDLINKARNAVAGQKIVAVPTDEPWADCGSLNALYHTTMQIASNDFPLEDFERKHVLDSINTQTGLVASSKEQKEAIEGKYDINGEVMVVPKAKKVDASIVDDFIDKGLITVNERAKV